jgi:phage tail-like protein
MAKTSDRIDPYRGFNFHVEIDNTTVASFSEVSGLTAEGDAVDYREGMDRVNSVRKLPALRKYSPVSLKNGIIQDMEMYDWYAAVAAGDPVKSRRNGKIVLCDEAQTPVIEFHFVKGFLNKLEGPHLVASSNEVAVQTAEIVHEGLTIKLAKK